jgi:DNA primase
MGLATAPAAAGEPFAPFRPTVAMIPNDFIETLLSRVDIVDVIDRFVPLKKAGANYVACCPFHSEKTPSFSVSPTKQFYHCFGCGAHGTAVGFLMEHAGKSFPDAVEELARDAGLEVPRTERPGERERREEAQDLNELLLTAAKLYRSRLKDAPQAIEYLKSRGLTGAVAAHFGIGYAPDAWQSLAEVFPKYDDPALEAAGLVIAGDGGKRYDRFRDRIMFPIHDSRGRVIGFGGRVLGAGEPKYLNSPETPVFSKGRELYGLYLARNALRNAGRVVVVEGYMDVVALAQHGIEYAVATLGTATTPVHAQKLFRLTDSVVYCFDGDNAGRKAAWRALENTLPVIADGKNATFLFLPDGEDPDDFVRKRGKAAFEAALAGAMPLSEFLLAELAARHPPASPEGKAALVAAARPMLAEIGAPVLSAILRKRLADLAGLPEEDLRGLLAATGTRDSAPAEPAARHAPAARPSRGPAPRTPARRPPSLTRQLIQGLLHMPALAKSLAFPPPDESTPEAAALTALVAYCAQGEGPLPTATVLDAFADTAHARVFQSVMASATDHRLDATAIEAEVRDGLARWWQQARRTGIAAPPAEVAPEEDRRLQQLEYVRRRAAERVGGPASGNPETPAGEGEVRDII